MTDWQGPYGHRDENTDPKLPPLMVFFREDAVKNERASQNGPAVYDTVSYIKVVASGQKQSFPIYEFQRTTPEGVTKEDKAVCWRFRGVIDDYRKKQAPSVSGTPLEQWPLMDRAMVAALKDANVFTVQQLAALPDGALGNVRGKGQEWRAKAKAWLEDAGNAAVAVELRAELAKRDEQISDLQKQVSALLANQNGVTQGFQKKARKGRQAADGDDIPVSLPDDIEAVSDEPRI
jgi:hypothetical protein